MKLLATTVISLSLLASASAHANQAGAASGSGAAPAASVQDAQSITIWLRPDLPRDRSLVTVSALIASAQVAQIPYHLNRAMDNGLTQAQAMESRDVHLGRQAPVWRGRHGTALLAAARYDRKRRSSAAVRSGFSSGKK